jgi:hypothetical protein
MVCPLDNKTISQIEASTGLRVKPILFFPEDILRWSVVVNER